MCAQPLLRRRGHLLCARHGRSPLAAHLFIPQPLQGTYIDKKCPFTGNVAIRGRILKGIVVSTKMQRTIVIRRDYLQFISKYRCVRVLGWHRVERWTHQP